MHAHLRENVHLAACMLRCLCVRVVVCSCMRAYVSLLQHRAVSFEVCLPSRSLAENTGMAICDTIDTWHVNTDNNSVIKPPAALPFLTFIGFGCRHNAPSVPRYFLFSQLFLPLFYFNAAPYFIKFCHAFVKQWLTLQRD